MARRGFKRVEYESEFDLDLAPLLAVMVKLVPVLLLSSAFVQLSIIETELPQMVQAAVEQQEQKTQARLMLEMSPEQGFQIQLREADGTEKNFTVPMKDAQWDYANLHKTLVTLKTSHPSIYKLEFAPSESVKYQDVIRATDEARKARDSKIQFPIQDTEKVQIGTTNYMFPDVTFTNMLEGE